MRRARTGALVLTVLMSTALLTGCTAGDGGDEGADDEGTVQMDDNGGDDESGDDSEDGDDS